MASLQDYLKKYESAPVAEKVRPRLCQREYYSSAFLVRIYCYVRQSPFLYASVSFFLHLMKL